MQRVDDEHWNRKSVMTLCPGELVITGSVRDVKVFSYWLRIKASVARDSLLIIEFA
jgi:hypothetical protein